MNAPKNIFCTVLLASALAAPLAACGGSAPVAVTPVAITGEVTDMPVLLVVQPANAEAKAFVGGVQTALQSAMATAGYKVVQSEREAALVAKAVVTATEKPSMFQTMVNGQRQVTYKVRVDLVMNAAADTQLLDQDMSEFESSDGTVNDTAVRNALALITNRGKITAYADSIAAKETKLWEAANVEDCRKATSDTACDGVEAYMKQYPAGAYTAEARKAIEDGKLAKEAKQDDEDWARAKPENCKDPKSVEDCEGVSKYLEKYPTGAHADEGKEVLTSVRDKLDVLAKKAEAEAAKRNKSDCIKRCKQRYERYVYYSVLATRCIQNSCQ